MMATLQMLSRIGGFLLSISGQHEHQRLLRPENHLLLLDSFGGLDELRRDFSRRFTSYRNELTRLRALEQEIQDLEDRRDLARFQEEEIRSARIEPGEDLRLEEERNRLRHAGELREAVGGAYQSLYEQEGAVLSQIAKCERSLAKAAQVDPRIAPVRDAVLSARAELEDAALELRSLRDDIPMDPGRLEEVEDRVQLLNRLKRKYGPALEDVIRTGERLGREMDDLEERRSARDALKEKLARAEQDLAAKADSLSQERKAAAGRLTQAIEAELALLAMERTRFQVRFEGGDASTGPMEAMGPDGLDRVEFMLAPNVGEDPRPLAKTASGGELSRIMLALKTILAETASVETVVFDEVDAGIGGATAETVGRKLKALARYHQILCITHLPQIASMGDSHFLVEKGVREERTEARVAELDQEHRVEEIARLLSGKAPTTKALDHAREMLAKGREL
jgi:DNA repair protein RecN (Recombination protein N)